MTCESSSRAEEATWRVDGIVVRGVQRGAGLGFPTANVAAFEHCTLPIDGVYAGHFRIGRRRLPAAISVGTNPTFAGRTRTIEAHVLDVREDFYDQEVGVEFVIRLRGMERFDGVEALIAQMHLDVASVRDVLGATSD